MAWGAIIGAVLSGISSRSAGKKEERNSKEQREWDREQSYIDAEQGLRTLGYANELQEYSKQRDRNSKAAGWDNFYNPAGKPGRKPATMPSIADYLAKPKEPTQG